MVLTEPAVFFGYFYVMKIKIPIQLVELEDQNFHILVRSGFADETAGVWVIDTGASKTVFDKNLTQYYTELEGAQEELHTAGIGEQTLETTIGVLGSLTFGKCEIKSLKVALIDLTHINGLYKKAANLQLCGLIGSDFLLGHKAVIDYRKRELLLQCERGSFFHK